MIEEPALNETRRTYTLTDLSAFLWRRRTVLLLWNVTGILIALVITFFTQPSYTATLVVADAGQSQLSSGLSQLANLTGHSLGTSGPPDLFNDFVVLYRSQTVAELADRKYHIRQRIFSSNWNKQSRTWDMSPQGPSQYASAAVHFLMGKPTLPEPTYAETSVWLTRNISLTDDQDTGQWTAQMQSTDPKFAQWILRVLYDTAEGYMREVQKRQTQQQVDYLNKRLTQITVEDYRQTLLDILSSQEKSLMMLDSDAPVAARVVMPSTVTDQPTAPSTTLNVAIGFVVSFILGIAFVVWLDWRRAIRRAVDELPPVEAEMTVRRWFSRGTKGAGDLLRGRLGRERSL